MRRRLALALVFSGAFSACGWDGLFFTPRSFEPTEAPRAVLVGNALAGSRLELMSADGEIIARGQAPNEGEFRLALPSDAVAEKLRLIAVLNGNSSKAIIPRAEPGLITGIGNVDALSTAATQVVMYKIQSDAASSMAATPATAIAALLSEILQSPSTEFQSFSNQVANILAEGSSASEPAFELESYRLSETFIRQIGEDSDFSQRYQQALASVAVGYELLIRCDPSRLNVLFAVDVSGRARDGTGNPQLIRQPTKESNVYLGLTTDESSPVLSPLVPRQLRPNDPEYAMNDDGKNGDELARDGIYSRVVALPRGARIKYKYTNGAAGEGFTGTEEWPGNARILQIEDILTSRPDGKPDCLLIRRDAFGDEGSNKNFVNLHPVAKAKGGSLGFETDLGGLEFPQSAEGIYIGGLSLEAAKTEPLLTAKNVPEARENGRCLRCPPPLVLDPNDQSPPRLLSAERISTSELILRFSEPILSEDAQSTENYLYLNDAGQSVRVVKASAVGSEVHMTTEPSHPRSTARIRVRSLRDVSASQNVLTNAEVELAPDQTAPKVSFARALSLLDVDPMLQVSDPTVGELVEIQFDETPERIAAEDPSRYSIPGLEILSATWVERASLPTVYLRTSIQNKGVEYRLEITGLKDIAGNAIDQTIDFSGFALYRVRFSVLVGFAFADSSGEQRGLPRSEQLFLTGTPLGAARDLNGKRLSIFDEGGRRTDVTGWPQFEMKPAGQEHQGKEVHELELLLPAGRWAWKAAHGLVGEYRDPPNTLEKVYKTLASANDGTAVRIDPRTMLAENREDYTGASLSETGIDPPRRNKVFKREAPDEVCDVVNRDVSCPMIVVGAWRDWVLDPGGRTRDYDDGLLTLAPHRPTLPDLGPPRLHDARARDSHSVLLSFDEALSKHAGFEVEIYEADKQIPFRAEVAASDAVAAHQMIIIVDQAFDLERAYVVRYRGAQDLHDPPRKDTQWRTATFLSPDTHTDLRPFVDTEAPKIINVVASDITNLQIRFDETIDPGSLAVEQFRFSSVTTEQALTVHSVTRGIDGKSVELKTDVQPIREPYRLEVEGVGDIADPSNVMTSTTINLLSFGETIAPEILRVRGIDAHHLMIRFNERIQESRATQASTYRISGLEVRSAVFSGDPQRRSLAFNSGLAPHIREIVVLETSAMTSGQSYTMLVDGIQDLSGNTLTSTAVFLGADQAEHVDIVLEYEVSNSQLRGGRIPSRAIGLAEFSESREGLYVLGARLDGRNQPVAGRQGAVNQTLGGFPPEGQPLDGIEARLRDDGRAPDRVAGDGVFSILLPQVPLGTNLVWKAFAPFTTEYRDANPTRVEAAFADALPGPNVYADGQEYPGNENGATVLDEGTEPGVLRIRCLFGDEFTYKKHTGGAPYYWAASD